MNTTLSNRLSMVDKFRLTKLQRILLFYLVFSGLIASLVIFGDLSFLGELIPSGTVDYYLYEFDQRVQRFNAAPSPRVVILGTCYAAFLGESDTVYNLGLATGNFDEQRKIAEKYISPDDKVLYVFGLPELAGPEKAAVRPVITYDSLRRLFLTHSGLSSFIGTGGPPIAHSPPTPKQIDMLKNACGLTDIVNPGNLLESINTFSARGCSPTLKHLKDFQALHKNTIFLYHPPLKITPVDAGGEFAEKLRRVSHLESETEEMLRQSSLPYIDLSAAIDKNDYADLLHLRRESLARLTENLPALLENEYNPLETEKPDRLKPYKYGTNIEFGRNGFSSEYQGSGWSDPEGGFTWTEGKTASLTIPIEKTTASDIELTAMLSPFLVPGKLDRQTVNVHANGKQIGEWVLIKPRSTLREKIWSRIDRARRFQEKTITIPADLLTDSMMTITFGLPDAAAPSELGVSGDERI